MPTALLSQTGLTLTQDPFGYVELAGWALVALPLTVVFLRALARSSYPFGRPTSLYCRVWLGFLLPRSGYISRTARVLMTIMLIFINLAFVTGALSLLIPAFQAAEAMVDGVSGAVFVVLLLLVAGALLASEEPDQDKR